MLSKKYLWMLTVSILILTSLSCLFIDVPLQIIGKIIPKQATEAVIYLFTPTFTVPSATPIIEPTSTNTLEPTPTSTLQPTTTSTIEPTPTKAVIIDDQDTLMHRGNLERSGVYQSPGPKTSPNLLWTFEAVDAIYSSPAIFEGVAFFGSNDGNLYAVDISTGEAVWVFETGDRVRSSPAIWNGAVFFGSDDGTMYALDIASGDKMWAFETGDQVYSSPAVSDGMVIFGSWDGFLYALNAQTGLEVWRFEVDGINDPTSGQQKGINASPAVSDGVVLFGSSQDGGASRELYFYGLDIKTGQKLWTFSTWNFLTSPAVYEGNVYFGGGIDFYGLDIQDGSIEMTFYYDAAITSAPVLFDGMAYFGSDYLLLHAIDLDTVVEKWNYFSGSDTPILNAPSIADGVVYSCFSNGLLTALDAKTGGVLWKYESDEYILTPPVIANGVIYFGTLEGHLFAVGE